MEAVKAVHAFQVELVCSAVGLPALKRFADDWFADPRNKPAE